MPKAYLIFHLNLAFSSIEAAARPDVIRKCYWPLLELIEETGIPLGIELTGWTLQQIAELDPAWVKRFRVLLESRQCELIGSGWSQIIGPLVPHEVNGWNQKLGRNAYRQMLGTTPKIALVNEMAYSTGMLDVYAEAGYGGIVMDRDNVRLALGLDHKPLSEMPTHALGCGDVSLPVLWSDSILFQRLQRVVHGDIPLAEYLAYVKQRIAHDQLVLPIYCNDAEIFDYRPGRFDTESRLHREGEWQRLKKILRRLQDEFAIEWHSPSAALTAQFASMPIKISRLSSITQPIPVKKQAKYNVSRWAVTGRDDLWLNTSCHRLYQALVCRQDELEENWRELCELWASDLRTHITDLRWLDVLGRVSAMNSRLSLGDVESIRAESEGVQHQQNNVHIQQDEDNILWTVKTPNVHLVLNARRGLTIRSLAFATHGFKPLIGTLPQGYFKSIELGADFYSGGVLIEIPGERMRFTDLEWVNPRVEQHGKELMIFSSVACGARELRKIIIVDVEQERVRLRYEFKAWPRPLGSVRLAILTFMAHEFSGNLTMECVNGGPGTESFLLDRNVHHGRAASMLVSSSAAFGCTNGKIKVIDQAGAGILLNWQPSQCAGLAMLEHVQTGGLALTRFGFSLAELDDTSRADGRLLPFELEIKALKKN